MSSASPFRQSARELPSAGVAQKLQSVLVGSAQFAGFWSAVLLPFAVLGFVVSGVAAAQTPLFVALLLANLVALRIGHGYNRA
ncbi:hypothetical protein BRC79_00670 [Halobacteriales archaeon QH_8_67_27]|nr:MAG: hypothetical protein BRC79_00670 [Halobacteriales archaeon QH_8_67_27]